MAHAAETKMRKRGLIPRRANKKPTASGPASAGLTISSPPSALYAHQVSLTQVWQIM